MKRKKTKPISLFYIVFLVGMIAIALLYLSANTGSFIKGKASDISDIETYGGEEEVPWMASFSQPDKYNKFLLSLRDNQAKNVDGAKSILNSFLLFNGYPKDLIGITVDNNNSRLNIDSLFYVAKFDIPTGKLIVSPEQIENIDVKTLITIIAHEFAHFEEIAKVCKDMGEYEFGKLVKSYGINNYNQIFWVKAAYYSDLKDFDSKLYTDAFIKFLDHSQYTSISPYSGFQSLRENTKNPLYANAESIANYIKKIYGIKKIDTPTNVITRRFNDIDWSLYNLLSTNKIIKGERAALFDYVYANALLSKYPELSEDFEKGIKKYNGDLSLFWKHYQKIFDNIYTKGNITNEELKSILNILNITRKDAIKSLEPIQMANALKYRAKTLLSNIKTQNDIDAVRHTIATYFKYTKENNISNSKTELDLLLTLICIDNKLYTNTNHEIKISSLKVPEELKQLSSGISGHRAFEYVYKNDMFQKIQNKYVLDNEALFLQLLKSHLIKVTKKD